MDSRLYLPKLANPSKTVLEYLAMRFPHIDRQTWHERVNHEQIWFADGTMLQCDTPYRHGITVVYSRAVANEPESEESEIIVYQDEHILVADKPHGMVVTPVGNHVERSLLARLRRRTRLTELTPMHRLDRETAGIILFAVQTEGRKLYHRLFANKLVEREYLAVARLESVPPERIWNVANRIVQGEPWFRRRILPGDHPVNALTRIELREYRDGLGLFDLRPDTGKKHQLRLHMASIGFPIFGDLLYPEIREPRPEEPSLQLLAHRLTFADPLSGESRRFNSLRSLRL